MASGNCHRGPSRNSSPVFQVDSEAAEVIAQVLVETGVMQLSNESHCLLRTLRAIHDDARRIAANILTAAFGGVKRILRPRCSRTMRRGPLLSRERRGEGLATRSAPRLRPFSPEGLSAWLRPVVIRIIRQQLADNGMNAFPVTRRAIGNRVPHLS
jgi:hypothetical protein